MNNKGFFPPGVSHKTKYCTLALVLSLIVLLASTAYAGPNAINPRMTNSQKAFFLSNPNLHVEWNDNEGIPYAIRGLSKNISGDRVQAVTDYIQEIRSVFKMTDANVEMKLKTMERDELGFEHYRFHQSYQGIKVVNSEIIVQVNERSQISQINGQYYPGVVIPLSAAKSGRDAMADALQEFAGKPNFRIEKEPELVIYPQGLSIYRLAYHYILYYNDEAGDVGRWVFYVDANTGEIINRYNDIQYFKATGEIPAGNKKGYPKPYLPPTLKKTLTTDQPPPTIAVPTGDGTHQDVAGTILAGEGGSNVTVQGWHENTNDSYYMYNKNLWWYIFNSSTSSSYSDANTYAHRVSSPDWGVSDRTEISAARNMKIVQDYFKTVHSRNSFDNASAYARVKVHVGTNYVNAYWDSSNHEFAIGDGDGSSANSLAVLDVLGHEFAHAWTQHTSNLTYQGESGALNESISDIMGTNVEFYAQEDGRASYPGKQAGKADWLQGEDCWLSSTALRDMRNPASTTTIGYSRRQPSRYHGQYWRDVPLGQDNGGVHYNGGPQNFFYYLLAEGGSGVNDSLSYAVNGIGINNARLVAYRTNTYKLTSSSGYAAARAAWISAATDLNTVWADSVRAAWDAVGIIDVPANVTESFEGTTLPAGWTTGGSANWSVVTSAAKHGSRSVRSGVISDSQTTWLQKTISLSAAGNVSFFVLASSEMGYDKLEFYVDGSLKTTWSGDVPWSSYVINLGAGSHTLKWQYIKDPAVTSGSDAVWIDALTYEGGTSSCTYSLSPTSGSMPAAGGADSINVTAASGCSWTATSSASWITITSGSSGSGNGAVTYTVTANTSSQRTGTITIADQTYTVSQAAASVPSTIGAAVDNTSLTWTTSSAAWYGQSVVSYYGGSAAQSGAIGNNGSTWVQTTVTGPAQVSFYWKVSSEANYDYLRFYIDGVLQSSISGNVDWQRKQYSLAAGSHTLKWQYSKDAYLIGGSDAGWIDKVTVEVSYALTVSKSGTGSGTVTSSPAGINCGSTCTASYASGTSVTLTATATSDSNFTGWSGGGCSGTDTCTEVMNADQSVTALFTKVRPTTIAQAVDNTSLVWTTGGNANWYPESINFYFNNGAAQSGAIDNSQSTWVQTTVTGPGTLSFYWKVSSESSHDFLRFYIDGSQQDEISGEVEWQKKTYSLSSGSHTLKWIYIKDEASRVASDAGWLDKVTYCTQNFCCASPINVVTNSVGTRNTIKITDMSGALPVSGGPINVEAWDAYGNPLVESGSPAPLKLYSHGTTPISGSELAARFSGSPLTYEIAVCSSAMVITNVKSSADGTLNIPIVYTNGVTNYISNSIGARNAIKITDLSGAIPPSGAAITVTAWDTNGYRLTESGNAAPLKLYNHGTTSIPGPELAARFPGGAPMTYLFDVGSGRYVITNVKNSSDGSINIPHVFTYATNNFVANSIGARNTIRITDLSGSLPGDGAAITIHAWDVDGNTLPQSGTAAPLKLYMRGTTQIKGSELAARFPTGTPMAYEFVVSSSKYVITNVKNSADGTITLPSVYSAGGMTNYTSNSISGLNTIKITDMSGSLPYRSYITITAWDANGNAIPESGTITRLKFYNRGTVTISGTDLAERFPTGTPAVYEFAIDSTKVVITNLTSSTDGILSVPIVFINGTGGGI